MSSILTTTKPHADISMADLLSQLTRAGSAYGGSIHIAGEYARLARGPGKISPADFMHLRLFDKAMYGNADMREFAGDRCMRDVCLEVNYRRDWFGMLSDKVASTSYLEAHGLSAIPAIALYVRGIASDKPRVLQDGRSLEDFLLNPDLYPLFGKPVESQNSLGSIALLSCSVAERGVVTSDGAHVPVKDLASEIDGSYPSGYLFQQWIQPHPEISALTKGRLATVRFLTTATESGPKIFRACLKIPAGANVADNYWREGNILAQLDLTNGRILHATSGAGVDMREQPVHPETNVPLIGFHYPQWEEMKALALRAAKVMRYVPLIGWDIACSDRGPTIVEMNEFPDAFLMQFADRRGILDPEFMAFMAFQKGNREAFDAEMQARYRAV